MHPAETYILNQPEPYRTMLLHLQALVQSAIPNVELKYKWRIPCFYVDEHPICYLNASVKGKYVDLGLWNAAHLTKHVRLMHSQNRKVVKSMRYKSLDQIDNAILIEILQEAFTLKHKGFYKHN